MAKRLTPHDQRLPLIADMTKRGLKQSEIARALGLSQQSVSRLQQFIATLSPDQLAALNREQPTGLLEMIEREKQRRAIGDQIYEAHKRGDDTSALWDEYLAL
jgi:transcriptional regulator with XRE-family HTH domain